MIALVALLTRISPENHHHHHHSQLINPPWRRFHFEATLFFPFILLRSRYPADAIGPSSASQRVTPDCWLISDVSPQVRKFCKVGKKKKNTTRFSTFAPHVRDSGFCWVNLSTCFKSLSKGQRRRTGGHPGESKVRKKQEQNNREVQSAKGPFVLTFYAGEADLQRINRKSYNFERPGIRPTTTNTLGVSVCWKRKRKHDETFKCCDQSNTSQFMA